MATSAEPSAKPNGTAGKTPARARKTSASKAPSKAAPRTANKAATASKAVPTNAPAAKQLATDFVSEPVKVAAAKAPPAKPARAKSAPARKASPRSKPKPSSGVGAGTVLGVAAAGLAAGLVANLGRKAAVQASSVMAGDWLEALKAEHKAALALLDQMAKATAKQPAKRTMLLMQLKHALGKHAFTEENVIYPALREWGDKADADQLNHEQGYHKQFLYELDGMDKAAAEWATKVADFRADLVKHIRDEEDKIFPKLHKAVATEKNKALTSASNREGFKLA